MPQIAANILPSGPIPAANTSLDLAIRTKSAAGMARQRATGLLS